MPYIKSARKHQIKNGSKPENKGELNYSFCIEVFDYLSRKGLSYQNITDAIGALEDSADELRRRILHVYENIKMKENGDILPEELFNI